MPQLKTGNEKMNAIMAYCETRKTSLEQALPKHLRYDRVWRVFLTEFRRVPKLLNCEPASVYGAFLQASQLGLEIGVLGHCWLVPFKQECQLLIGYKGLKDLAMRSGRVVDIQAYVVYGGDEYEYSTGLDPVLRHVPKPDAPHADKDIVAAYAVARVLIPGSAQTVSSYVWKWRWEIDRARSFSQAKNGPWFTHFQEMAKKTAVKALCNQLPQSAELARAIALDDLAESDRPQGLETTYEAVEEDPANGPEPEDESQESAEASAEVAPGEHGETSQAPPSTPPPPAAGGKPPVKHSAKLVRQNEKTGEEEWLCPGCMHKTTGKDAAQAMVDHVDGENAKTGVAA